MRFSYALTSLAIRIAPAGARVWAEGLKAELGYVPAAEAASFAAGAIMMAVRLRLSHPPFVHGLARYGLAAAALIWAGLQLRLALDLNTTDRSLPTVLTFVTACVFGFGGLLTAVAGLRFTVLLGVPLLVIASVYAAGAAVLMPQSPNRALYQALAIEDAAALLTAVLLAALASRYAARRSGNST